MIVEVSSIFISGLSFNIVSSCGLSEQDTHVNRNMNMKVKYFMVPIYNRMSGK